MSHVDQVFTNGSASDKTTLINQFGWHTLEDHPDDAAGSRESRFTIIPAKHDLTACLTSALQSLGLAESPTRVGT